MDILLWLLAAYVVVGILVFIGLCKRYEPLDLQALFTLALAALIWPVTVAGR